MLPGVANGVSRLDLARNTLDLIADFPFTGGGLGAFAGLYSRYIMALSVFLFSYSHNLFLDVALEQGVFGFLALMSILGGSAWLLIARSQHAPEGGEGLLRWAIFASLVVVSLHGLIDDALYANRGTPLLFLLAGMAVAVAHPSPQKDEGNDGVLGHALTRSWKTRATALAVVAALATASAVYAFRQSLLANGYANLGAARMARVELAGWHDEAINEFGAQGLDPAAAWFHQALGWNPGNRTAHHRLGLIALRQRDFQTAAAHLQAAHRSDVEHRGVRKVLGYTYVWLGQLDRARTLLASIPEAETDMGVYAWWWGTQGRDDLASQAEQMANLLAAP
jgi:tetratricopeptide (TPR) repeat protein